MFSKKKFIVKVKGDKDLEVSSPPNVLQTMPFFEHSCPDDITLPTSLCVYRTRSYMHWVMIAPSKILTFKLNGIPIEHVLTITKRLSENEFEAQAGPDCFW